MENQKIRLILSGKQSGAFNMALDEALWQTFADSEQPSLPILRFYGWQPTALSIGYAQNAEQEVNFEACAKLGIDWLRRPTGGRAILHEATELTYSFVADTTDPRFGGDVLESYRKISQWLVKGLARLGVEATLAAKEMRGSHNSISAACFDAPSAYEVICQERKIIGSAQARRKTTLLQQGTILLAVDVAKLFSVLKLADEVSREVAIASVKARLISIEEALGQSVSFKTAQTAFVEAFAAYFEVDLILDSPTKTELALTDELIQTKYAHPAWNMARQRPVPVFTKRT